MQQNHRNVIQITYPSNLPIFDRCEEIKKAIAEHPVVIVAGETGSGKTTQLPKMCLETGRGSKKRICCTQPRRIAAFSVAARVADELEASGNIVGYKVRFRDQTRPETRIKFVTDGMLLAETQGDPLLKEYDTIIIDEAHERSLNIDFLLGILKRIVQKRRDLHVLISSATLDVDKFSRHFKSAPVIEVIGRSYPIETRYLPSDEYENQDFNYITAAIDTVQKICTDEGHGDILVFMPSERDIVEITASLKGLKGVIALPLFGRLSAGEQKRIFRKEKQRKVVVATNVAETSLTVPGIRFVVDSGLARIAGYNARSRTTKLPIRPISKASAKQRKGRCGRVGPGICYRLFSEESFHKRPEYTPPEIVRSNLAEVILRMMSLQLGHPAQFPFIDNPSPRSIRDGFTLLEELGAIKKSPGHGFRQSQLTKKGRFMARLPLDPRISKMILEARQRNCLKEIVVIASALSVMDPRVRPLERQKAADLAHQKFRVPGSDFMSYLKIWDLYHQTAKKVQSRAKLSAFCKKNFLGVQRMREWCDIHQQICGVLRNKKGYKFNSIEAKPEAIHQAILSGSLRTIALKKKKQIFVGAHGKEVMIFPGSSSFEKPGQWIMAAELVETNRLYARTVATIDPAWIQPIAGSLCSYSYSDPHWEKKKGRVMAHEKVSLFGLLVSAGKKIPYALVNREEARQIFIQSALVEGECPVSYPFLEQNKALLLKLQEGDERIRKRRVIDDYGLFQFYDRHLPIDVFDLQGLNRVIKRVGVHLLLKDDDVLLEEDAGFDEEMFPEALKFGNNSFQLSYRFAPGDIEDGVTVILPVDLLPHVSQQDFDWLVPGLLVEKITWLLKGLPKKLRKKLVPLPQSSQALVGDLDFGKGSFRRALERAILKRFGLVIPYDSWQFDSLPDHLKMRFCLKRGETVTAVSRELKGLGKIKEESGIQNQLFQRIKEYEERKVTDIRWEETPERIAISTEEDELLGFAFPGLRVEKDTTVTKTLFGDAKKRKNQTIRGLIVLSSNQFSPHVMKEIDKGLKLYSSEWPLYEGLFSTEQIHSAIHFLLKKELFGVGEGLIPTKKEFQNRIDQLKNKGLLLSARAIFDQIKNLLIERRLTLDHIHSYQKKSGGGSGPFLTILHDVTIQLQSLFPPSIFYSSSLVRLNRVGRYFKGIRIRVERAYVNSEQDVVKTKRLEPFVQKLRQCSHLYEHLTSEDAIQALEESVDGFGLMVEDFRLSLYAQELKTFQPVSEKRLERKWQEIERIVGAG